MSDLRKIADSGQPALQAKTAGQRKERIDSAADIERGLAALRSRDPRFAAFLATGPDVELRRSPPGFETLLRAIISQQLSVAAAESIWRRLTSRRKPTATAFARARTSSLFAAGLSRQKIAYVRHLARAVLDGSLPLEQLPTLPAEEAIASLVAVKGIGRWTAEIYLMFALGDPDVFPAGDLALQEAARMLFGLESRPTEADLRRMAAGWAPWRAVAARVLWRYYREAKQRAGVTIGNATA